MSAWLPITAQKPTSLENPRAKKQTRYSTRVSSCRFDLRRFASNYCARYRPAARQRQVGPRRSAHRVSCRRANSRPSCIGRPKGPYRSSRRRYRAPISKTRIARYSSSPLPQKRTCASCFDMSALCQTDSYRSKHRGYEGDLRIRQRGIHRSSAPKRRPFFPRQRERTRLVAARSTAYLENTGASGLR